MDKLLEIAIKNGASDLHISAGYCPCIRVDGGMRFLTDHPVLTAEENLKILEEIMPERNQREFEQSWDTDFGYEIDGIGRFRVNGFKDAQGTGGVFRTIPTTVPSLEGLGLSFSGTLRELSMHTKGLIIVTGPTGSGKSTTLAAMVDLINRTRSEHIITVEDPIEFSHESKGCLINQREVHRHTRSFAAALRAALREDPDIVLLGEMRDLETTEIALETAETGHLVLATLHTNTATSTVDRIIDKFPAGRQNQIRTLLANTLTAVVAQTLCKKQDGGRVAAAEILVATSGVRSMIRDAKTHQLPTAIQVGYNVGMRSFTDSLYQLVADGLITPREAYLKAVDKLSIEQKFEEAGIDVDKTLVDITPEEVLGGEISPEEMNSPEFLKERAWLLATNRNSQARDGERALELAQRAIDLSEQNAETLMILAAALAENQEFKEAVDTVKQAIQAAKGSREADRIPELKTQLAFYKKGQPHPGVVA
ncbi:MAG: PilT/PilU family type 4a pilus ATPase [Kiritimatiellales bacterium]|nr:PilT/PilU family type 4a pilus ATPase [Kiritimatiellales bacterium]